MGLRLGVSPAVAMRGARGEGRGARGVEVFLNDITWVGV